MLLTFIKLPFVFETFVLSIFEWLRKTGFTLYHTAKTVSEVRLVWKCKLHVMN